jgi:flavin-dependent thymidylate synthase
VNVQLISYTQDALTLLLRTKNTRLGFTDDPAGWSEEKRAEHLAYMRDTIRSSWEFIDYVFEISGVSRAFTHQLVRTRTGSYAQESQRTVDVSDHEVFTPPGIINHDNPEAQPLWDETVMASRMAYAGLLVFGVPPQDARGILPTNVLTSIFAKFNLRTLSDMAKVRLCTRTQGEYQQVFRAMRRAVLAVHPWAEEFIEVHCVATGTCAFPRYGKTSCPVYLPEMDTELVRGRARMKFWSMAEIHEARPIAKEGKAQ